MTNKWTIAALKKEIYTLTTIWYYLTYAATESDIWFASFLNYV